MAVRKVNRKQARRWNKIYGAVESGCVEAFERRPQRLW
jgi:hypothetical protein